MTNVAGEDAIALPNQFSIGALGCAKGVANCSRRLSIYEHKTSGDMPTRQFENSQGWLQAEGMGSVPLHLSLALDDMEGSLPASYVLLGAAFFPLAEHRRDCLSC